MPILRMKNQINKHVAYDFQSFCDSNLTKNKKFTEESMLKINKNLSSRSKALALVLVVVALVFTSLFADEMFIAMGRGSSNAKVGQNHPHHEVLWQQMYPQTAYGEGVVIYEQGIPYTNTLTGYYDNPLYAPNNPIISERRWASSSQVRLLDIVDSGSVNFFHPIPALRYYTDDMRQLWYHVRSDQPSPRDYVNPNPWVYRDDGMYVTYMMTGLSNYDYYDEMYDYVWDQMMINYDPEIFSLLYPDPHNPNLFQLDIHTLTFGVLLLHIKNQDWDFGRGLQEAISNRRFGWQEIHNFSFILSDGYEVYAYRGFRTLGDNQGDLHYYYDDDYAAISTISAGLNMPESLLPDELLYMPMNGVPVRFQRFSTDDITMTRPAHENWNFDSFPVLPNDPPPPTPPTLTNFQRIVSAYNNLANYIRYEDSSMASIYDPFTGWDHFGDADEVRSSVNLGMQIRLSANTI